MIENYKDLINSLNGRLSLIIGQDFKLNPYKSDGHKLILFRNTGSEIAINRLDGGDDSEVDVYKWFDNYYIYIEVKFIYKQATPPGKRKPIAMVDQCSISVSILNKLYDKIVQLFRAESDEYSEKQDFHPQPHWHITSDTSVANTFSEYAEQFGEEGFMNILKPEKEQISSLKKFHFAMKGKWEEGETHSSSLESSEQVSKWMSGLLNSIREELEYIDK